MARVKIAVIGAGSFVFGPSVLSQAFQEHRLDDVEFALMDVDAESVEAMAGVGRRMAREAGVRSRITTHTTLPPALDGADFVVNSACRQIHKRYAMDCDIVDELIPGHLISEFGGIAGISYSLRQIALIEEIVGAMRRGCPNAWLLNVANPLPRVCQAAHELSIKTAGFCSVSACVYGALWRLFHGESLPYPWQPAQEAYAVTIAGLNHCAWLLEARDRKTGEDLLPALREKFRQGESAGNPRCERFALETGYLLLPNDNHTRDFLEPEGATHGREEPSHGTLEARPHRLALLRAIAEGTQDYDELLAHPSWERTIDWIAALTDGKTACFHTLSLINDGQISNLPASIFAETSVTMTEEGAVPTRVTLPESVLPICQRTALVTETIVQAARERSRRLVHEAVAVDPTVLDKAAGVRAIDACLQAHADVLPEYH